MSGGFPDDIGALNNAAVGALQSGNLALAITRLEKLVALVRRQAHAHNNLGYALISAGRPAEAVVNRPGFSGDLRV